MSTGGKERAQNLGRTPKESLIINIINMGNKQRELELRAQSESYDVIGITETWWDNSHD